MQVIRYNGFEIESGANQLRSRDEWTLEVIITEHDDVRGETAVRSFSAGNMFPTKEGAG